MIYTQCRIGWQFLVVLRLPLAADMPLKFACQMAPGFPMTFAEMICRHVMNHGKPNAVNLQGRIDCPLVNVNYGTMEHHSFFGEIHDLEWAIFNSYVCLPEGVYIYIYTHI